MGRTAYLGGRVRQKGAGPGRANRNSFPAHCFPLYPWKGWTPNPLARGTRPPDLSAGAAHDLEVVIDGVDNGEETLIVVVETGAEDHGADNVGHRAAQHKLGVEGLA